MGKRLLFLLSLLVAVFLLVFAVVPVFAEGDNPFGTIDAGQMASAMASFIGYFQGAIAIIVGVFAAVVVIRGIRSSMGGGG